MKKLLIVLLIVTIYYVSIYIINVANPVHSNSTKLESFSASEIENINAYFEKYKGKQSGVQVSELLGRLIANSKVYEEATNKIPIVIINEEMFLGLDSKKYAEELLQYIESQIIHKTSSYYVKVYYQSEGYIYMISIQEYTENSQNSEESFEITKFENYIFSQVANQMGTDLDEQQLSFLEFIKPSNIVEYVKYYNDHFVLEKIHNAVSDMCRVVFLEETPMKGYIYYDSIYKVTYEYDSDGMIKCFQAQEKIRHINKDELFITIIFTVLMIIIIALIIYIIIIIFKMVLGKISKKKKCGD